MKCDSKNNEHMNNQMRKLILLVILFSYDVNKHWNITETETVVVCQS